jgi:acyl carrier protein
MAATQQEVFGKVQEVLMDALGVDQEEVVEDAELVSDLGAESIDFLDIAFRLEKAFGIKIEQGELFPDNVLNDPKYVNDGMITEFGLSELRKRLPHANLQRLQDSRKVDDFPSVFTVDSLVKFVQSKLAVTA